MALKGFAEEEARVVNVNLIPFIDVLSNILFFLMVFFAQSEVDQTIARALHLPLTTAQQAAKLAVRVSYARDIIYVEDKPIMPVEDGLIDSGYIQGDKIIPLYARLLEIRKDKMDRGEQKGEDLPIILFFADKDLEFQSIYKVMKTSGMAGYPFFRFAAIKNQ